MDAKYIKWAKAVEAEMVAKNGPDYRHDSRLAKAAYAMGLDVQEAAVLIASELKKEIDREAEESKKSISKLNNMVAKAVGHTVWAIEEKLV